MSGSEIMVMSLALSRLDGRQPLAGRRPGASLTSNETDQVCRRARASRPAIVQLLGSVEYYLKRKLVNINCRRWLLVNDDRLSRREEESSPIRKGLRVLSLFGLFLACSKPT